MKRTCWESIRDIKIYSFSAISAVDVLWFSTVFIFLLVFFDSTFPHFNFKILKSSCVCVLFLNRRPSINIRSKT